MSKVRVKLEDFTKGYLEVLSKVGEEDIHFLEFCITEDDEVAFMSVDIIDGDGGTTEMFELDDINVNYTYKLTKEYKRVRELEEMLTIKTLGETEDGDFWARKQEQLEEMKNEFFNKVAVDDKDIKDN